LFAWGLTALSAQIGYIALCTTFKFKGHGHQATLLTAVLVRQAAAVVGVGTCWTWETAAMLPSAQQRKALRSVPTGEERVWGISWRPPACSLLLLHKILYFAFMPV